MLYRHVSFSHDCLHLCFTIFIHDHLNRKAVCLIAFNQLLEYKPKSSRLLPPVETISTLFSTKFIKCKNNLPYINTFLLLTCMNVTISI